MTLSGSNVNFGDGYGTRAQFGLATVTKHRIQVHTGQEPVHIRGDRSTGSGGHGGAERHPVHNLTGVTWSTTTAPTATRATEIRPCTTVRPHAIGHRQWFHELP